MSVKAFGIDPSLTSTGWSVVDASYNLLAFGTIKPKKLRGIERWKYILDALFTCWEEHVYSIKLEDEYKIFIENYPFGIGKMPYSGRIFDLAELGGVIKYNFSVKYSEELIPIATQTAKKAATGKGNSSKEWVQECLKKKYSELQDVKSKDVTDAIAVSFAGLEYLKKDKEHGDRSV